MWRGLSVKISFCDLLEAYGTASSLSNNQQTSAEVSRGDDSFHGNKKLSLSLFHDMIAFVLVDRFVIMVRLRG